MINSFSRVNSQGIFRWLFLAAFIASLAFLVLQSDPGKKWLKHRSQFFTIVSEHESKSGQLDDEKQTAMFSHHELEKRLEHEIAILKTRITELDNKLANTNRELLLALEEQSQMLPERELWQPDEKESVAKSSEFVASVVPTSTSNEPSNSVFSDGIEAQLQSNTKSQIKKDKRQQLSRLQAVMNKMEMTALEALSQ
ncbi:hypothetical protein ISG33_06565 [Glaciecola sp. MH2013]|uniref:hypothetical protein n=1 Tax=Glaciecola sp. MH2013 TaxID=2785524 RepID=UPI00189FBB75|nr:hypothetical protein [Glaciecola sp. MH2013]MBF7073059.1 hypothetical protein [Glaciecola sp. MH2013]